MVVEVSWYGDGSHSVVGIYNISGVVDKFENSWKFASNTGAIITWPLPHFAKCDLI